MTESTKQSIRYFLPDSPFLVIIILLVMIILGGTDPFMSVSMRFLFAWLIILKCEAVFPVAWRENKRTATSLMDALLVPYNRKQHLIIQIILMSLLFYVPQFLMNVLYALIHELTLMETLIVFVNHLSYSIMFLISVIGAQHVLSNGIRLTLQILSIFWGIACGCIFTELLLPNPLFLVLPIVLILWGRKENTETKENPKVIHNNLSGILKLSKMQIIKERPVAESIGYGISFYWIYNLISRTFILFATSVQSFSITDLLDMEGLLFILILVSIITSINALRRIYVSKNMLKVIPVKKSDLFTASTFLALRVPVLIQLISVLVIWLFAKQGDYSVFFASTHPLEIIIHGLFLAVLPTCIYLICFTVYAREDRFVTAFLFVLALLGAVFSYKVFTLVTYNFVLGKAISVILLIAVSHILAWTSYRKMQNVHS